MKKKRLNWNVSDRCLELLLSIRVKNFFIIIIINIFFMLKIKILNNMTLNIYIWIYDSVKF